jgi:hypothetical protein
MRVSGEDVKMKPIINLRICCIEPHVNCHLKISVKFYLFRTHVDCADWRMMRYLLQINAKITKSPLKCLSQNRIKRFLNVRTRGRDKHESTCN